MTLTIEIHGGKGPVQKKLTKYVDETWEAFRRRVDRCIERLAEGFDHDDAQ